MSATDIPFLRLLERADADALLARVRRRRLERGAVVLSGGSAGDQLVLLLEGRVKVVASGADGRDVVLAIRGPGELLGEMAALGGQRRTATATAVDDVVLAIRGPGELLGEMAALGGQRRTATATAVDDVEAGYLEADVFRRYLAEHPDAAMTLIRMLVRRLSESTREVVDLATQDSVGRVAKRLLELAEDHGAPDGEGTRIDLSLTQDELASWTGATRETVSRALRLMRQLGWIATENRSIVVLDAAAMRERCGLEAG